jgi:hypothetical protein
MLSGLAVPALATSHILQQTLENELCIVLSGCLFQIVYISHPSGNVKYPTLLVGCLAMILSGTLSTPDSSPSKKTVWHF